MSAFKLTEATVEKAVCPEGKKDRLLFDSVTRGFGLRVTAGGSKVFLAQYYVDGTKRRVPLGVFGALTVEQARKKAKAVLGDAARGRDEFADRKARKAAAEVARAEERYTFGRLIEAWASAREGDRRPSYLNEAIACVSRNLDGWEKRPASSITTKEVARELDRLKKDKGLVTANRTLAYARAAYSWAVKRHTVDANPFKGVEQPGREQSRDRVLEGNEVGAIWRAAGALASPYDAFVRMLLLTGQRRNEVAGMRWDELSADLATWSMPSARAKNAQAHIVHVAEPAREILRSLPRLKDNALVFPGERGGPISSFSHAKDAIETALAEAGEAPADWRFHDFRRAMVTWMAGAGIDSDVADRILNHRDGHAQGVKGIYQRFEYLPERKAALDAWAKFVLAVAEGREPEANVVPLLRTG